MCKQKPKTKTYAKVFGQVWFYSVAVFLVCKFGFSYQYSLIELLQVFLPTIFEEYWFFTTYIVMLIICPYLNMIIEAMDRKQHLTLMMSLIVLWIVIPTFTTQEMGSSRLTQFICYYIIGAFFRNYPENIFEKRKIRLCTVIASFLTLFLSTLIFEYLASYSGLFANKGLYFFSRHSFMILWCAVGLFTMAVYKGKFVNPFVNMIANCTFGVYLFHDNPVLRRFLWGGILGCARLYNTPYLILGLLISVVLVFTVGCLIELIRKIIFEKATTIILYTIIERIVRFLHIPYEIDGRYTTVNTINKK